MTVCRSASLLMSRQGPWVKDSGQYSVRIHYILLRVAVCAAVVNSKRRDVDFGDSVEGFACKM